MGRVQVRSSRRGRGAVWARVGVAVGGCLFAVGLGLAAGLAAALMAAGGELAAFCLLLVDVEPGERGEGP